MRKSAPARGSKQLFYGPVLHGAFLFVQDGTRDGEHIRHWMHGLFETRLKEAGVRYAVLSGSHDKRLKEAVALIDEILKSPRAI